MKTVADTRKPYSGLTRSLVIAIDVGTTFSGVSYAILEPGEIPKIHGVTRFPGQEHVAGNSKIPSILYYDKRGELKAAGAEADNSSIQAQAEDDGWIKVELFKLRLRPRTMHLSMNGLRLAPLPPRKSPVHIFGDFLSYLYTCTTSFIKDTHANGSALLAAIIPDHLEFVLAHPNGWEGAQQAKMRRAAVYGGLVGDIPEGRARIRFVTEGEASLHACVLSGLAADVLSNPSKHGFLIADAGGGTLDISSYAIKSTHPLVMEEIAPPDCIFAGSVFVSRRAREFFEHKLKGSQYGTPDSLDHITKRFDETTKRLFRDRHAPQFVPFGSPFDKDSNYGIRAGQLKLTGAEVANVFEPSVDAAYMAIRKQIEACHGMIKSVFLVGGYAASPWLFAQLHERLAVHKIIVSRPDTQTSKAVADGAIGFYCDHHVSARMSRFMYGVEYLRQVDLNDPDHVARLEVRKLCELPSGPKLLPDAFDCILARGVKVKEATVFTRKYCTELTSLSMLRVFEVEVWCYRGGDTIPKWIDRTAEDFSTLCVVKADLSMLSDSAEPKTGRNGKTYWTIVFSVEIHFGLTEFRARIKWVQDGATKYGPATIVYNERGHRSDEDEPDFYPEDDAITGSGNGGSSSSSRAGDRKSHHTSSRPQTPVNGHPVDSNRRTRDGSGPATPSIRGSISNSGAPSLRASSSNAPSVKPAGSPSVMASASLRASGGSNPPTPNHSAHVPLRRSNSRDKERERERSRPSTPLAGSRSGRSSIVHPAGSPAAGAYSSRSRPRSPVVDPPIPPSPLSRSQSQAQSVLHSHRTSPAKLGEATDLWGGGGGVPPPQSIFGEDLKSAFGVSDDILGGERPKSLFDTDGDEGGGEPSLGGVASSIFGEPATAIHDGKGLGGAGLWGTPTDGPPPPVADGWDSWGRGEGQALDTPTRTSATPVPATPVVASAATAAASVVGSTLVEEAPPISPAVSKSGKKKKGATPKASPAVSRANSGQDAGVKALSPLNPAMQEGVATPVEAPAKQGGDDAGERGAGVTPIEIPVTADVVQEDVGTPTTPAGEGVGSSPVTPGGGKKKKKKGVAAAVALAEREREEADRKVKEEKKAAEEAERKAKEAERKAKEEERRGKEEEEKKAKELKEEEERKEKEKERLEQERLEKEKAELEEKDRLERERQRQEMDTKAKIKLDREEKRKEKEEKERRKKEEEQETRNKEEQERKNKEQERKNKEEQERKNKEEQERKRKEEQEEKVRKAAEEEAARLKKAKEEEEAAARLKEEEKKRRAEEDARLQAEKEEHEKTVRKLQEAEDRTRRELEELELQEKREEKVRKEKEERERKARESNSGGFGFGFASKSLFGKPASLFGSASPTEEGQEESTGIGGWGFGSLTKKKSIAPSEASKRPSPFAKAGWGAGATTQPPGAFDAIGEKPQLGNPSSLFGDVDVNNVFENFDSIGLKDISKPAGGVFEGASVFGGAGAEGETGGAIFEGAGAGGGIFDGSGALGSELGGAGTGGGILGGAELKAASRPPSPPSKSEVGAAQPQTPLPVTPAAEQAGEDSAGWDAVMVKGKKKKGGKNSASNNVSQQPTRAPSPDPAGRNLLSPTDDAGGNTGEDDAWGTWGAVEKKGKKGKKGKGGAGGVGSPATGAQTPQVQAEAEAGGTGAGENLANDLVDLPDDGQEAQEEDPWSQPAGKKKKGKKGVKEDPPETPAVEEAENGEGGGDEKNEALEGAEGDGEEGGEKKDADDGWAFPVKTKKKKGKKGAAEDNAAAAGGESGKPADDDGSAPAATKKKKKKK